jgi:hypothetical protein
MLATGLDNGASPGPSVRGKLSHQKLLGFSPGGTAVEPDCSSSRACHLLPFDPFEIEVSWNAEN